MCVLYIHILSQGLHACVCMHIYTQKYLHICKCIYMYTCIHAYINIYICTNIYTFIYTYMHTYMWRRPYIYVNVCMYICMYSWWYLYMYVYVYVCVYTYIRIYACARNVAQTSRGPGAWAERKLSMRAACTCACVWVTRRNMSLQHTATRHFTHTMESWHTSEWWQLHRCNTVALHHTAIHCNTLQHTATASECLIAQMQHCRNTSHCSTLQHTATASESLIAEVECQVGGGGFTPVG